MIVKADKNYRRASITKRRGAVLAVLFFAIFMSVLKAGAHEFWLEPASFVPALKTPIPVSIRVGQQFKGDRSPDIGSEFRRFAQVDAAGERALRGTDGDDPALTLRFANAGLVALIHESTFEKLNFETWIDFRPILISKA